jgi:hypothetical protein
MTITRKYHAAMFGQRVTRETDENQADGFLFAASIRPGNPS